MVEKRICDCCGEEIFAKDDYVKITITNGEDEVLHDAPLEICNNCWKRKIFRNFRPLGITLEDIWIDIKHSKAQLYKKAQERALDVMIKKHKEEIKGK